MAYRQYTFTFASGATGTNKQFVGNHEAIWLIPSATTNWNAGTGNGTITIRGGLSTTDTHADIQSMSVATITAKSVIPMPYAGLPNMSIGFGTAVTGGAANTIDVIVYSSNL